MAVTHRHVDASREDVFAVLEDGWRYAEWVVGAQRIRDVDATWPEPGSRFHHRIGIGPLAIDDSTVLEAIEVPRKVVLRARARPTGVARVTVELEPAGAGTEVVLTEEPVSGVAKRLHNPLQDALIHLRNKRSLDRLADLVTTGS
jgi:hypothetical protein